MVFTKHVIERFQERITSEAPEVVRCFIKSDIEQSTLLYRKDNIEKRRFNDITYVVNCENPNKLRVITLYIKIN